MMRSRKISTVSDKSIVKGCLQRDDFVVDDGAGGYMDNGMDDWMDGNEEHESENEEIRKGIYAYNLFFKDVFNVLLAKKMKGKAAILKSKSKPAPPSA